MSTLNLDGIKDGIKNILDANNTITSGGLSFGLTEKVKKVLQVNPYRIPIEAPLYPCVTMYLDGKEIRELTMNKSQANGRRLAELDIKIVGIVWDSTIPDPALDKASEGVEKLMENIEEILRSDPTLSGTSSWSFPTDVTYHTLPLDEEHALRAGIMNYRVKAHY